MAKKTVAGIAPGIKDAVQVLETEIAQSLVLDIRIDEDEINVVEQTLRFEDWGVGEWLTSSRSCKVTLRYLLTY